MTAIELLNLALLKIGVSKGIAALDEASREAYTGALVYDHTLRMALRRFPWPFATKYAVLDLTQGPAWTDAPVQAWTSGQVYAVGAVVELSDVVYYCILGHTASGSNDPPDATYWSTTATTEANGDWDWAYRWPTDCIFARRIVPQGGAGRVFSETPVPFRIGRDSNGLLVYTDEQDATLEYTTIDCTNLWADDLFIEYFVLTLGAQLAPSLSRIPDMATRCLQMSEMVLDVAASVATREGQQHKAGDAEWVAARG